ncbi:rhodanese-like domain-containing protein [Cryobacterium algoritolerans]|uniref:Rhodanese-like domain-containing protein n=1 Tax=Cryobacterium algoritolerans TaxID=1259184 RepID=A0A4R8WVT2_9MICO|nr:rhodanese-like domain-containing protein [Cryobacterium algoritolerans]TFC19218.1 rhodanese-like domain-containing protein [Cryobacterium algoritolerans]
MNEITVADLSALTAPVVIDVREPFEYADGHMAGVTHIPLGELVQRQGEVPHQGPVYLVCAVGGRSAQAAAFLAEQGVDAVNVTGGMTSWRQAGLPIERKA